MKILIVSWEYPPVVVGGLGRHVHHLATELAAAGHEVVVGIDEERRLGRVAEPEAGGDGRGQIAREGIVATFSRRGAVLPYE